MQSLLVKFQKFFISGGAAAVVNFSTFYFLYNILGLNYVAVAVVSFLTAFIFAFLLHRYWSFSDFKNVAFDKQLVLYFLLSVVNLVLTIISLYFLVNFLYFPVFISYVFSAGATTVFSFIVNNFIIFNKTKFDDSVIWKMSLIIFCVAVIMLTFRFSFYESAVSTDTLTFIETTKYYLGETNSSPGFRLLKPLPQFALAFFHKLQNIDYYFSFSVLNSISFILLSLVSLVFFYVFSSRNKYFAYAGSILTFCSYPIFRYGLDPMVEIGAMLFVFMSVLFIVLYSRKEKLIYLLAALLFILVGFLWKEYTALSGVSLFFVVCFKNYKNKFTKKYLLDLLLVIVLPIIFLGAWSYICYVLYGYTYLDWLRVGNGASDAYTQFTLFYIGKSFFATLLVGWVFVLIGVKRFWSLEAAKKSEIYFLAASAPLVFTWGYVSSRLYFPVIIPFIILGAYGLVDIREKYGEKVYIISLFIYILTTLIWTLVVSQFSAILK